MIDELVQYLTANKIVFSNKSKYVLIIDGQTYELVMGSGGKLFGNNFELLCGKTDEDNYIFNFGGKWYYTPKDTEKTVELNEVKYLGKTRNKGVPFLGIHGKFEILNGSREYDDWCKKAKFNHITTLGICEKNTLAGVYQFQKACLKHDIKPIIGASFTIFNEGKDYRYTVKCYVKNETGWTNLLRLNKLVNIDYSKYIPESKFFDNLDGICVIVDPKSLDFKDIFLFSLQVKHIFFQLDSACFTNNTYDEWYLNNLQKYLKAFSNGEDIYPIFIQDAYYLDKEDAFIKVVLNKILGTAKERDSSNQYFKFLDDVIVELSPLMPDKEKFKKLLLQSINKLKIVDQVCNFQISTGNKHLPQYTLTDEQKDKFSSNEDLLGYLIKDGLKRKVVGKLSGGRVMGDYIKRIQKEFTVIKKGDVIDYFLILWDIIKWSRGQGILTGIGRGSAAGSLISYLLDLVEIDPLVFDLLIERFLNDVRMGEMNDCEKFIFHTEDGIVEKWADELICINRKGTKVYVPCGKLIVGDEICKI